MLEPTISEKRWWHGEDILLLVMLAALLLLPGLYRIPLFDRDEPRFAVAARNMLDSHDFIVPTFNGMLRPDKPPLVYWLMDAAYLATGGPSELGARLPSVICGTLTLILLYFMVGARFGRLTGFVAALIFGTCALFLAEARMATADATMLLGIVASMACAWQAWDSGTAGRAGGGGGTAPGAESTGMPRTDYLLDRNTGVGRPPMMLDQWPATAARRMSLGMALLFWIALAFGTLAKGVPLLFVFVPMIILSLATGALPAQLRRWRSHFQLTRWRVAIGFLIAAGVIVSSGLIAGMMPWLPIVGIVLIGMTVTPGLPGVLARCIFHGNWSWWRQLRPALGVPVLLVLVGWWVVWAGMATHWKLIQDMVGTHFLNRVGLPAPDMTPGGTQDPMRAYSKPPGLYLLLVWATFWPWSILLIPAAFHTWRRLRGKTALAIDVRPYQFLVAWIIPMWILLELARGKLVHYPLPLYVPIAILCADTLVQSWNRMTDVLAAPWFGAARWVITAIWCALGLAVLLATHLAADREFFWKCFPFGIALLATGLASSLTWGKPSWPYVLALCWGGSLMVANVMILPEMPELQVSRIAGTQMKELLRDHPDAHLAVCGYEEATLVFYSGQNIRRFESAADLLRTVPFERTGWRRFWPVQNPASDLYIIAVEEKTRLELDARHIAYTELPRLPRFDAPTSLNAFRIPGFNTGNMRPVIVTVISNQVPQPAPTSREGPHTTPTH